MAKVRVLVVEDEESIQALIRLHLRAGRFRCGIGVERGRGAHAFGEELPAYVVLLTWMLPGAWACSCASNYAQDERSKDLPIILLTARSEAR